MNNTVVLMSTYNGASFLSEQINSVLAQDINDLFLLVRDDGSNDQTCQILQSYDKLSNFHFYKSNNIGVARSFFDLIANAPDAEYYAFADQDDVWDANKLSSAIDLMCKYKDVPCICYSNARIIDETGNITCEKVYDTNKNYSLVTTLCSCNILGCSMVMNRSLITKLQLVNPKKIIMHDCYVASVCKALGGKIIFDDSCRFSYRQHRNNVIGYKSQNILAKLFSSRTCSIADQAADILMQNLVLTRSSIDCLSKIAKYKKNFLIRVRLVLYLLINFFSGKVTKHEVLNAMRIFLGKA